MAMNTTPTSPEAWRPNVVSTYDPDEMLGDALIVQAASFAGSVEGDVPSLLVPYVSADPDADFVAEGEEITPNEGTFDQVVIQTHKVAVLSRVSRELTMQPGAAERIANSLRRAVTAKADVAFIQNVSAPVGLENVSGLPNAGTIGTAGLGAVYAGVGAIESDGGSASHLLINPKDWAGLAQIPAATGSNQSLLADVHSAAERSIAGVPVIVHNAVSEGQAILIDRTEVVAAYGQLQLARSEDVYFTQDAIGVRATWRIGWNVVRPNRVQLLTVDNA